MRLPILAAAAAVMVLVVEGPKVATRAPASAWAASPTLVVVVVASPRLRWAVHPRTWDIRRSITRLSPIQRRRRSQCSLSR